MTELLGLVFACYLMGSIPLAWIVTKVVTGKDLRREGSGNVGVMNTALTVARWAGLLVFLGEASKGVLAVWLARRVGGAELATGLAVVAVVVGTRWSIWMKGAGGRGNTAGGAALIMLAWPAALIGIAFWFLVRYLTHSSFWATRIGLLALPAILGLVTWSWWYVLFGAVLSLIYLSTQKPETDDHSIIKEQWPTLWSFLSGPRRKPKA
jgi:glycerol-3-phosphate acyltransferase PlsY